MALQTPAKTTTSRLSVAERALNIDITGVVNADGMLNSV